MSNKLLISAVVISVIWLTENVLIGSEVFAGEEIMLRTIRDGGFSFLILVEVFKKAVGLVFVVKPMLLVKITEMETFA